MAMMGFPSGAIRTLTSRSKRFQAHYTDGPYEDDLLCAMTRDCDS